MSFSTRLQRLIDAAAPYWAGEAAVFETYWTWEQRTREIDIAWLNHQCFKEIWGSGVADKNLGLFLGPLEELKAAFPKIDVEIDRHEVLGTAEALWAEFAHYCAFADAHDGLLLPGEPKINPKRLKWWTDAEWKTFAEISVEQLRHRILMRNAQFGRPLEGARLEDALAGRCQPVRFDYERAQLAA